MVRALVIGTSAGGLDALEYLIPQIPSDSHVPVFVVQHIMAGSDGFFIKKLNKLSKVHVLEPVQGETIQPGMVYIAPPDRHLIVRNNDQLILSSKHKINYSRPSIDVLFESAAHVYHNALMGILLTGANGDGSKGLKYIYDKGGITVVQNPDEAWAPTMPMSAIKLFKPHFVLRIKEMSLIMQNINNIFS